MARLQMEKLARAASSGGLTRFGTHVPPGSNLFVTFGSSSLAPFVSNWVSALADAGVPWVLVGALDVELHAACDAEHIPAVLINTTTSSDRSAETYIRKDYARFKVMGARKVRFLTTLLEAMPSAGLWVCDADMVFLKPPPASFMTTASLAAADVALSTDCLDLKADLCGDCARVSSFNTGVLFLRNTKRAKAFVRSWAYRMDHVGPEPWLDDQAVLNEMVRGDLKQLPPPQPHTRNLTRDDSLRRGSSRVSDGLPPCGGSRTYSAMGGSVTLGLLPLRDIANGHTFFVQHPCAMCRPPLCSCNEPLPFAVHTTYQYGDTPQFAYGKRDRLVQSGLWRTTTYNLQPQGKARAPEYGFGGVAAAAAAITRSGGHRGPDVKRVAAERFVVLSPERSGVGSDGMMPGTAGTQLPDDSRALIRLHKRADLLWRKRVLALMAVAIALNRTAVLPPAWCYCDIFWGGMRGCRVQAASSMRLPFECPLDHVLELPRWHAQTYVKWRPPRYLETDSLRRSLERRRLVFGTAADSTMRLHDPSPSESTIVRVEPQLSDSGVRGALERFSKVDALELDADTVEDAICGFEPGSTSQELFVRAARLLRFARLFCHVEGAAASTGDAAPCCTNNSLRTGWTNDEDPRGRGFLPCAWGFAAPDRLRTGLESGECAPRTVVGATAEIQDGVAGHDDRDDVSSEAQLRKPRIAATLAVCVLPTGGEMQSRHPSVMRSPSTALGLLSSDGIDLVTEWMLAARAARGGTAEGILVISSSKAALEAATRQGVKTHALRFDVATTTWASEASGCVSHVRALLARNERPVVLSTPSVIWRRDPTDWIDCGDGGAESLSECAPLGPADMMAATDMLSTRQDALWGAGHAKYGHLDLSLSIFRPRAGGRAAAAAWQLALEEEHDRILSRGEPPAHNNHTHRGPTYGSWATRSGALFGQLLAPAAGGLQEMPIVGVRQPSRLYDLRDGLAVIGVLPLSLFAHGHGHWIQRAQREALAPRPFAIRLHMAPLHATQDLPREVLRRLQSHGLRQQQAGAIYGGNSDGASARRPLVTIKLPSPLPAASNLAPPRLTDGPMQLHAHGVALAVQLRIVDFALHTARTLGRSVVLPRMACYCDRDPSGGELVGLLSNGCKLPSAESEAYLPFECPFEDVFDDSVFEGGDLLLPSAQPYGSPADSGVVRVEVRTSDAPVDVVSRIRAEINDAAHVIQLAWTDFTHALASRPSPRVDAASMSPLALGPRGGWCASCAQVKISPETLPLGFSEQRATLRLDGSGRVSTPCSFCLNFSVLLSGDLI